MSRAALVTGASRGIGRGIALALAGAGHDVVVNYASNADAARAVAREIEAVGAKAHPVRADVADAADRQRLVDEAYSAFGRLDLLVNNAGAAWRGRFGETGWEHVRRHMEINFDAVVRLTEALLPLIRRSAPSAIVNVSSVAGRVARGSSGGYSASKFALTGWTDALHLEERRHGVHVGLVLPGFVTTEGFPQRELHARALTRRLVSTPKSVADAIVDAGLRHKTERYVPRPYAVIPVLRVLAPWLVRRATGGGGALTPATGGDTESR
jgi:uncharacterized protein